MNKCKFININSKNDVTTARKKIVQIANSPMGWENYKNVLGGGVIDEGPS